MQDKWVQLHCMHDHTVQANDSATVRYWHALLTGQYRSSNPRASVRYWHAPLTGQYVARNDNIARVRISEWRQHSWFEMCFAASTFKYWVQNTSRIHNEKVKPHVVYDWISGSAGFSSPALLLAGATSWDQVHFAGRAVANGTVEDKRRFYWTQRMLSLYARVRAFVSQHLGLLSRVFILFTSS